MLFEIFPTYLPSTQDMVAAVLSHLLCALVITALSCLWQTIKHSWKELRRWRVRARRLPSGFTLEVRRAR